MSSCLFSSADLSRIHTLVNVNHEAFQENVDIRKLQRLLDLTLGTGEQRRRTG